MIARAIARKARAYGAAGTAALGLRAADYYARRYLLRRPYFVRRIHDYRMRLDLRDPGLTRDLAIRGTREEQLKYILDRLLRPGQVVLDVGANVGYYAIMEATRVGPDGHVYALEPEPRNYGLLNANVELNGLDDRMETFNLGAADRAGRMRLFISDHSNLHTLREQTPTGEDRRALKGDAVEVPTVDLATFLRDKRAVDLIRMDIEGFEVEVLRGLLPAVEDGTFGGAVVFEVHTPDYDDAHDIREPLRRLFALGYRVAYATSNSDAEDRIGERGYEPVAAVATAGLRRRRVYARLAEDDLLELVCDAGGVRDVAIIRAGP